MSTPIFSANSLVGRVDHWTMTAEDGINYTKLYDQLLFLAQEAFNQYVPTIGPHPMFMDRLGAWLANVREEEDQKLLLRLATQLLFMGQHQFTALYRAAFGGPLMRYLIGKERLPLQEIVDGISDTRMADLLLQTWFCPVTDSMDISGFYHANRIEGRNYRPSFMTLARFGSEGKVKEYLESQGIRHLVLLEDFVGTGSQMERAVRFAASLDPELSVLFLPLIVCPSGAARARELSEELENLAFESVLPLQANMFVGPVPEPGESEFFGQVRELTLKTYELIGDACSGEDSPPYGPFGYGATGGLVVLYTNTPNNSLPLIHHESTAWSPLFPRSTRVE